jgi:hypothetical protein
MQQKCSTAVNQYDLYVYQNELATCMYSDIKSYQSNVIKGKKSNFRTIQRVSSYLCRKKKIDYTMLNIHRHFQEGKPMNCSLESEYIMQHGEMV